MSDALSRPQERADSAEPVGLPYGIIDPDYARAFTIIRATAWSYGYAVAMQGSFTRDLDLLVVPWTEHAAIGHEEMLRQFERTTGLKRIAGFNQKPKGRVSCSLALPGFADPRWIDISFTPAVATPAEPTEAQLAEGAHVLSEWMNDKAPLGEGMYLTALREALIAMRKTPPDQPARRLF